jgi:hypothetical protein
MIRVVKQDKIKKNQWRKNNMQNIGYVPTTTTSYWSAKVAAVLEKARHAADDDDDFADRRVDRTANFVVNIGILFWLTLN